MKYQLEILKNTFKHTGIFFIIYIIFLVGDMWILKTNILLYDYSPQEIFNYILNFLCYPVTNSYNLEKVPLFFFNILCFIIFILYFYMYENIKIHNNMATRYESKKWVKEKYIFGTISIIIISLIEYLLIYLFFKSYFYMITYNHLLYPLLSKLLLMSLIYFICNSNKLNLMIKIIFIVTSYFILINYNLYLYIIIFLLTSITNYFLFDLHKYSFHIKHVIIKKKR